MLDRGPRRIRLLIHTLSRGVRLGHTQADHRAAMAILTLGRDDCKRIRRATVEPRWIPDMQISDTATLQPLPAPRPDGTVHKTGPLTRHSVAAFAHLVGPAEPPEGSPPP